MHESLMHPSITKDRILDAVERQTTSYNPKFCLACGAEAVGVKPDARRYKCEACGEKVVYGAEELLLYDCLGGEMKRRRGRGQ